MEKQIKFFIIKICKFSDFSKNVNNFCQQCLTTTGFNDCIL
jgi:hypothetical protein